MADLKLGPIPKAGTSRLSIVLPEVLKAELDLYAAEYSRLHGEADAATLIPHMLESFLRSDRGWRGRKAAMAKGQGVGGSAGPRATRAAGQETDPGPG